MGPNVRYLLVTTDFPPAVGGVQRLLSDLCDGLSERAKVTVVTIGVRPDAGTGFPGYEVVYVKRRRTKAVTHLRLALRVLRFARASDLIIVGHVNAGPAVLAAHFLLGKPYVVYVHAMEVTYRKWIPLYRLILRRARHVVTGSSFARSLVGRLFGVRAVVVNPSLGPATVRTAVPAYSPETPRRPVDHKIILTVGRMDAREKYKGHDTLIRALPDIVRRVPGAEYWVVGDGSDRARLEALARELGVEHVVRFFGGVADVAAFYRACDVFVMVAGVHDEGDVVKAEGFGLVYIEAGLFGKPVIAADRGGATDAVIDGYTGFLIPPGRPDVLADKVVFLLTNPAYAEAMGRRGKDWVLSRFNRKRQLDEFEAVLLSSF